MTPALRTSILDALMERWRSGPTRPDDPSADEVLAAWQTLFEPLSREHFAACLDMILPVAEPMIREAALREAAAVVRNDVIFSSDPNVIVRAERLETAILALGEPK